MFVNTYNLISQRDKISAEGDSMQIFVGNIDMPKKEDQELYVIGRLVFFSSPSKLPLRDAFFAVVSAENEHLLPDSPNLLGVIRITDERSKTKISKRRCPVLTLNTLPYSNHGKIALLDICCKTLYVSPDIATVNRFNGRTPTGESSSFQARSIEKNGKQIKLHTTISDISSLSEWAVGALVDSSKIPSESSALEDTLYELYRDIAEGHATMPITISANVGSHFAERIRAIYRSAVWGDISLLLRGVLCPTDAKTALDRAHRAFCDLQAEGREFNGYIKKGLCIDTPYLLQSISDSRGIDFLVFDAERIVYLMTDRQTKPEKSILLDIAKIISTHAFSSVPSRVILGERTADADFCEIMLKMGADIFFAEESKTESAIGAISGANYVDN